MIAFVALLATAISYAQTPEAAAMPPGKLDIAVLPCAFTTNDTPEVFVNDVLVQPTRDELGAQGVRDIQLAIPEGIATIELSSPKCSSFAFVSILGGKERRVVIKLEPGTREPPGPDAYPFSPSAVAGTFPSIPGLGVRMCLERSGGDCHYAFVDDGAYYIDSLSQGKTYTLTVFGLFWSRDLGNILVRKSGMTRRDISLGDAIQP